MRRPVAFTILAGVAALLASLLVYSALKQREAEVRQALGQKVEIAVAAHDLPLGSKVDASAVKMAAWSKDSLPPGAFLDPSPILNSFVKSALVENEPLVAGKLFLGEKTAGVLPLLIPPGMRAMSVPVDEVSDIAGFVLPHARVDVLVALSPTGTGDKAFSKMVLQNVEVLAVAQEVEGKKDEPQLVKVVTLLVSPEEAERLALASREGTLRLAMRNYNDDKIVLTSGVDIATMLRSYSITPPLMTLQRGVARALAAARRSAAAAQTRPAVDVEILRDGRNRSTVSFINQAAAANAAIAPQTAPSRLAWNSSTSAGAAGGSAASKTVVIGPAARRAKASANASQARRSGTTVEAGYLHRPKTIDAP